jgi:hypothetical protein
VGILSLPPLLSIVNTNILIRSDGGASGGHRGHKWSNDTIKIGEFKAVALPPSFPHESLGGLPEKKKLLTDNKYGIYWTA